jgi:hypothetical protein
MDAMSIGFFGPVCQEGGPNESYENFRTEAWRANWVLKLMEAAGSPEGPNFAEFIEEVFDIRGHPFQERACRVSIDEAKSWAVRVVYEVVREQIRECYPTVIPVEGGFVQGWGFHSLISAMYLQLMWLLTATGEAVRWCKRPECTRVVAYEQPEQSMVIKGYKKNDRSKGYRTRSDKEFCSDRCRGLYHYHYVKKKGKSRLKDTD